MDADVVDKAEDVVAKAVDVVDRAVYVVEEAADMTDEQNDDQVNAEHETPRRPARKQKRKPKLILPEEVVVAAAGGKHFRICLQFEYVAVFNFLKNSFVRNIFKWHSPLVGACMRLCWKVYNTLVCTPHQ